MILDLILLSLILFKTRKTQNVKHFKNFCRKDVSKSEYISKIYIHFWEKYLKNSENLSIKKYL